jgi:AmmeMemoRadiSam system protein B/AmmeMemoRadiSam system protein A
MKDTAVQSLLILLCACGQAGSGAEGAAEVRIRPPACAGTYYPADSASLAGLVDSLLGSAGGFDVPAGQAIVSGLVPHAGYAYSAPVAASFYSAVRGESFDRVYVLAPSHRSSFDGICVYEGDAFLTPLGTIPVDAEASMRLVGAHPGVFAGAAEQALEHAIEVQLPFLQRSLASGWKLVPILVGRTDANSLCLLAELLFAESSGSRILVIASADLSHYPPLGLAEIADSLTLEAWLSGSPERFLEATAGNSLPPGLETMACGRLPMAAVLAYNRLWGNCSSTILSRSTSEEASGDPSSVVGYASAVCISDTAASRAPLSAPAREQLCGIVRQGLLDAVWRRIPPDSLPDLQGELGRYRGVFVTYRRDGELRGCIGTMRPVYPVALATSRMARAAALEDPRFPAITPGELGSITFEISVLSPLQLLEDPLSVRIGTDGLLIARNGLSGVLLPQVPAEAGWTTPEEFLEGLCEKAGLPRGAWREGATLFRFQAEIFGPGL